MPRYRDDDVHTVMPRYRDDGVHTAIDAHVDADDSYDGTAAKMTLTPRR